MDHKEPRSGKTEGDSLELFSPVIGSRPLLPFPNGPIFPFKERDS